MGCTPSNHEAEASGWYQRAGNVWSCYRRQAPLYNEFILRARCHCCGGWLMAR